MTRERVWKAERAAGLVALLCGGLAACGDATCPKGSVSMGGDCVPIERCGPGEELAGGECSRASGAQGGADAGLRGTSDAAAAGNPCAALDCGEHGECRAGDAGAACACEPGWDGETCAVCAEGFARSDEGECVDVCAAPDAPDCGEHGMCVNEGGVATCACDSPYAGELCAECGEGFRAMPDGECVADCGDCGAHAYCDDAQAVPSCACVAGYRDDGDGDGCRFVGEGVNGGGLVDGELMDAARWETRHASIENGAAAFESSGTGASCELGWIAQRFDMPSRDQAEPLVLELLATTPCTSEDADACPPLLLELGGSVTRVRIPGGPAPVEQTVAVCLGDAAFGEDVELRVRPGVARAFGQPAFVCGTDSWPVLSALRLRPAEPDECPPAAGFADPTFESGAGWTLRGGARIEGGELLLGTGSASALVRFPSSEQVPSPALRMTIGTAQNNNLAGVMIDGLIWASLASEAEMENTRYLCIPDWAQGAVHELRFVDFLFTLNLPGTGVGHPILDLRIETEARCASGVFDRGFERAANTGSWSVVGQGVESVADTQAYAGNNSLRARNGGVALVGLVRIPEGEGAGHAGFSFAHRLEQAGAQGTYSIHGLQPYAPTTSSGFEESGWSTKLRCLSHAWDGQLAPMMLNVGATPPQGTSGYATFWIDEAGPVESTLCP